MVGSGPGPSFHCPDRDPVRERPAKRFRITSKSSAVTRAHDSFGDLPTPKRWKRLVPQGMLFIGDEDGPPPFSSHWGRYAHGQTRRVSSIIRTTSTARRYAPWTDTRVSSITSTSTTSTSSSTTTTSSTSTSSTSTSSTSSSSSFTRADAVQEAAESRTFIPHAHVL